ncbi:hypothetical protein SK128_016377, partial [Halocaridina rubra]
ASPSLNLSSQSEECDLQKLHQEKEGFSTLTPFWESPIEITCILFILQGSQSSRLSAGIHRPLDVG